MKTNILHQSLMELGLLEHEASLYTVLLRMRQPTVSKLARRLDVERLTVYRNIKKLEYIGLLKKSKEGKGKFDLEPPSRVVSLLKHRQSVAKHLGDQLTDLLPDLLSQYHQTNREPIVRFYETKESFMALLDEVVGEADKEIYVVGSTEILNFVPDYMEVYIKNRTRKGIISKTISFRSPALEKRTHPEELRQLKWVPAKFNAEAAYIAYGNKVAIWNTALPRIVMIEDKVVFMLFKTIFDMLWEKY